MNEICIRQIKNGFVIQSWDEDGQRTEVYCCDLFDVKKALDTLPFFQPE